MTEERRENQLVSYSIGACSGKAACLNDNEEAMLGEKPDHGDGGEKVMKCTVVAKSFENDTY